MSDVRIVRLVSGEDVIAFFEEDENAILLGSPMTIFFKRLPSGKAVLMLAPWIPIELIEDDTVAISYQDVLTVMNPRPEIIEDYIQSLLDIDNGQEEFLNTSSYDEDFVNTDLDEYESFNEEFNNVLNNNKSNKTIH